MKTIRRWFWGGLVLAVSLKFIHAQEVTSTGDTQVMLQALAESTPPVPASTVTSVPSPFHGFYSYQHPEWPPLPGNVFNLDLWTLGQGFYVLDDRKVDYEALQISFQLAAGLDESDLARSTTLNMSVAYSLADAARPYLSNQTGTLETNQTMTMSFDILGGTNFIPYDIRSTTNLTAPISSWTWLGIGYTSNRYTFTNQPQDLAFYALMRPQDTMTVSWGNNAHGEGSIPYGLTNAVQVAGGFVHSLALLKDGSVTGWGNNLYGQMNVPTNAVDVAMVAAGWHHSAALLTNGTVLAWGLDSWLGQPIATVPPSLTNATVISAHALHTLALREDGTVVAWGYDGGSGVTNVPTGLTNVVAIAAGYQHNLAAKADGTVAAWGNNDHGQSTIPAGATNVWDVAAGPWHSVALRKDGTVVCWGGNAHGECDVPSGLRNVVAIVAGGDWYNGVSYYTAALKQDGTVVSWGSGEPLWPVVGLSNVVALGSGIHHVLGIRTGPKTPVIVRQPEDQYQLAGGNVTFESRATGVYGVGYQWQHGGVDLPAETNTSLTLASVQATNEGAYRVVVSNEVGSLASLEADLFLVTPPEILSRTMPTNPVVGSQTNLTLQVTAWAPGLSAGFPLSYQWQFDGTNLSNAVLSTFTFQPSNHAAGTYSVTVANAAGSTNAEWSVSVVAPGALAEWGQTSGAPPAGATNLIALAAGVQHGVGLLEGGQVIAWGDNTYGQTNVPGHLTNITAIAAGNWHGLALHTGGGVTAWGANGAGQTNVPVDLTNAVAISAGGNQSLALRSNGTVTQWGATYATVPAAVSNVTAIASGTNFHLALLGNTTVLAWGGNDYGQTSVPVGLSNVVMIAAGGSHALALRADGQVVAWGNNTSGQTDVPGDLTNAMAVAAGWAHSLALRNDGTIRAWGDNAFGQSDISAGLAGVKLLAAGGNQSFASLFSPAVQYRVDVSQDLLLVYNTNSADSTFVKDYYLAHRPNVANANVLGLGYTNPVSPGYYETISPPELTNQMFGPLLSWLEANPTKRPQYVILFMDLPARVSSSSAAPTYNEQYDAWNYPGTPYASVGVQLRTLAAGWEPFTTHINMGMTNTVDRTNACVAYINKLATLGTNVSPGSPFLSASAAGYGNVTYAVDDVRYPGYDSSQAVSITTNGLLAAAVSSSDIVYITGIESNSVLPHITSATNVAGYISWGFHSSLNRWYAIDGTVKWHGDSGWYLIETIESSNGLQYSDSGNFDYWFASNAFGGTNYANTPVGAVTHVYEPGLPNVNDASNYFNCWALGKNLAQCAWISRRTPYFQVLGDPLTSR